ncbi:hypothetical protein HPB49_004475 [Dermacentor silvarum]|uniref:Uncharacterized protein n=1 Tax=Dermacentor silvarum TaxID=543639 RepID=A0ACB8DUT5_DERSI|nr:E3 ubiquitin-protein ligase MARCHF8 [Dermacentor silvarum]KAH7978099.1 hypothetical protein HPB49_004475 [Dermacentor silvarum]
MPRDQDERSNEETRAMSLDHRFCFRQVNIRTLRNRFRRENNDEASAPEENSCRVSLPSSSQCPETSSAHRVPSSDSEPSQSSAIGSQPTDVDSTLEGENQVGKTSATALSKDAQLPVRSPEAISDPQDDSARSCVSPDKSTGNLNGVGSSGPICRICHEGDQEGPLASPCSCSGTMGFVHVPCLEHWLNERNMDYCELCIQHFQMAAQPRSVRRFFHWVRQSEGRLRRALLCDLFCLVIVTSAIVFTFIMQGTALDALESKGLLWQLILVFVSGSFHACCAIYLSNRLRSRYHSFTTWHLANPLRRIMVVPSVTEVTLGQRERNDARAAGEPSTSGGRSPR